MLWDVDVVIPVRGEGAGGGDPRGGARMTFLQSGLKFEVTPLMMTASRILSLLYCVP